MAICNTAGAQYSYRVVARSGQDAPGTVGARMSTFFAGPFIDENGRVSFWNELQNGVGDGNISNWDCIYSEGITGGLQLAARSGWVAPGNVNYNMKVDYFMTMASNGLISFLGGAIGSAPPFFGNGIWAQGPGGALTYVAIQGESLPSIAGRADLVGARFDAPSMPAMSITGDVVFHCSLLAGAGSVTFENDKILLVSTGGGPYRVVAREGDSTPNRPLGPAIGANYGDGLGTRPVISHGAVAFWATFQNGPTGHGLFTETRTSSPPRVVVASGDPCPGLSQANFNQIDAYPLCLNSDGYMAFHASLAGPGVNDENSDSLWLENGGQLVLVARKGEAAPGGGVFDILYPPQFSGSGRIAFAAWLKYGLGGTDFTNDIGIYLGQNQGNVVKIVREGDPAPIPNVSGVTFGGTLVLPSVNNSNQVAFNASLRGGIFQENWSDSIWVSDAQGNKSLVALRGQSLEVAPGVFKTIGQLGQLYQGSASQDGEAVLFNNAGQIAFLVTFTDATTAVVVASPDGCVSPSIALHPMSQTVCSGGSAGFFVAATGNAPLTYQWRRGMTDLVDGGNISGTQTDTLMIDPVGPADAAGDYNCVVSNACGVQPTQNAGLSFSGVPMLTIVPVPTAVLEGSAASFTVQASGMGTPNYQWQKGGFPLADGGNVFGSNGPILTINPARAADAGDYECILSGACGNLQTGLVTLTVNPAPTPLPPPPGGTGPTPTPPGGQPTGNSQCGAMGGGGCGAGMVTLAPLMMVTSKSMRQRIRRRR